MSSELECSTHHNRKRTLWGVVLIAVGVLFLLDRMDIYQVSEIWRLWPFVIAVAGLVEILSATRLRHVTRGLLNIVLGLWFYAAIENLWGWTFGNSWPILMIVFGISVVLNGLVEHFQKTKTESLQ
ncbi:MAG TPA: DUF5668 domain-containing protein [Burkholderiaceae bacterium]|jgi:hypothetical protein|nr:DUF5668 domain-containing protein [Burkholderiaceae bacterium]